MSITLEQLEAWISSPEDECLEFKEAKNSYSFDKLAKYCSAFANEGGGHLILGVTNTRPRRVVGSSAFLDPGRTKADLYSHLEIPVQAFEILHPGGRVLIFEVPKHTWGRQLAIKVSS